ncbi:MAG: cytochrome b/b6 domain-containing protein [bacterium]
MRNWKILLLLSVLLPWTAAALDNEDCFGCHEDKALVKTNAAGKAVSLFVDKAAFTNSIHAKHLCVSCHADIKDVPHPDAFVAKAVSCAACHRVETQIYTGSDHGIAVHKGVQEAASCKDCHGNNHYLLSYRNPASPVYRTNLPKTCERCHNKTEEMEKFNLRQHGPGLSYEKSIHGVALLEKAELNAANCADCHGSHDLHKSTNPASKLNWKNVPATCGKCHENVNQTYLRSVHGQAVKSGVRDAPVCTDCHGEHTIVSVKSSGSRVSSGNIPGTCGQCHASQRIVTQYRLPPNVSATYAESFHGLDLKGGSAMAANCASCHGVHDILPSGDTRSSINPQNLPRTCGKCHPGIGTRMSADFFRVHAPPGAAEGKPWVVNFVSWGYIALIILVIGGMAGFVALDYLRKAREHIRAVAKGDGELRMTAGMRLQHHVLVVLFVLLAYTGLVHKSPDAFWSWPFHAMPNGSLIRSQIHHYCGWAFTIFFLIHLVALFGTRKGRVHAKALLPVWSDATDALAVFAHNIGLRKTPPPPRRWNYAEKAEYWALVWGSVVMAVTGAMLIFTETVLRLLPKVWHDVAQVIHWYEAVLAILAILVWHLYWVIFDPHEYPMNPSWLTGKKAPHPPHTPEPPHA